MATALTVCVLAGAMIIGIGSVVFVRSRLPTISGTLPLEGLDGDVRVIRDNWGIPHIYAENELDAFRALGFTAAQDRIFQMDVHRRLANGQLSEIVGEAGLPSDRLARTFGFRFYAEKLMTSNSIGPDALRAAEAYRDGINAFIETQTLPVEFKLLGYRPKNFEIVEMLAFEGFMSYGFSEAFRGDLLFSDLLRGLPPEKVDEIRVSIDDLKAVVREFGPD